MNLSDFAFVPTVLLWSALAIPVFIIGLLGIDFGGRLGGDAIGPPLPSRLGWFIMEIPALTVLPLIYLTQAQRSSISDLLVFVWTVHYAHRTLIWPWIVQRRGAQLPVITCASGFGFNVVNGLLLGWFVTYFADYADDWLSDPRFIIGAAAFLFGAALNIASDYHLAWLRSRSEARYVMPHAGPFRYISSPNLAGEMIEWIGFALMIWSLPGLAFAIWTVANLIPRALWRHRWFRETFEDYPENRRAIIPGLL